MLNLTKEQKLLGIWFHNEDGTSKFMQWIPVNVGGVMFDPNQHDIKLVRSISFKGLKNHGECFFDDSRTIQKLNYKDGKFHGKQFLYQYETDDVYWLKKIFIYKDGKKVSVIESFNPSEKIDHDDNGFTKISYQNLIPVMGRGINLGDEPPF